MDVIGKRPTNKKPDGVVQLLIYEDTFEVQMTKNVDILTLASLLYATLEYLDFTIGDLEQEGSKNVH